MSSAFDQHKLLTFRPMVRVAAAALAIGSTAGVSPGQAADMVTKAPPPAPVLATPWTGVYIGANVARGSPALISGGLERIVVISSSAAPLFAL